MRNYLGRRSAALAVALALSACAADSQEMETASPAVKAGEATVVNASNGHSGYYYPPPASSETFEPRSSVMSDAQRLTRLGFVTAITKVQMDRPYPPRFAMFAKGDQAQKLIIVGLGSDSFKTLYQARAFFAQLTAMSRLTPLFTKAGLQDKFTFFDLANFLGFKNITVSDGANWAHQIEIK